MYSECLHFVKDNIVKVEVWAIFLFLVRKGCNPCQILFFRHLCAIAEISLNFLSQRQAGSERKSLEI